MAPPLLRPHGRLLAVICLAAGTAAAEEAPPMVPVAPDDVPGPPVIPSTPEAPAPARPWSPVQPPPIPGSPTAGDGERAGAPAPPQDHDHDDRPSGSHARFVPRPINYGGALRTGLYVDGDSTTVFRALAALIGQGRQWSVQGSASVDVVSSASVDVRSSPLGKVDVVTSASGRRSASGGSMSDRRLAATLGGGWRDASGHSLAFSATYANETDYDSIGTGLNGSYDLARRTVTLLGGVTLTRSWVRSVLDRTFAQDLWAVGWTAGVAPVLSPRDVLRLRYDGSWDLGYQGSPYRSVRFGNWTDTVSSDGHITFNDTTGSSGGVPEQVPALRHRHALVLELLHAFGARWGVATQLRGGVDNWGVDSLTAGLELRYASEGYRFRLGYRFYAQSGADFYLPRYVLPQESYAYYTSDKELSREYGHAGNLGMSWALAQPRGPGDSTLLLDAGLSVLHYQYPVFVLLPSRTSGWLDVGLTWEL